MKTITNVLLGCLFALVAVSAQAQTADRKFSVGVNVGIREYRGDLADDLFQGFKNPRLSGGLNFAYYLSPFFDLGLAGNYGALEHADKGDFPSYFRSDILDGSLYLKLKMNNGKLLKENAFIAPYLFAGVGAYGAFNNVNNGPIKSKDVVSLDIPLGAGIRFRVSDVVSINVQSVYHQGFQDDYDGTANVRANYDTYLHHSVGVSFNLGRVKDDDKDLVPNKFDKCLDTRLGYKVDLNGCDKDSDMDGVVDTEDSCPELAGAKSAKGCPDKDGDGIKDSDDACPDFAGVAALNGCSDKDGDGVKDNEDKCPELAGLTALNGCPDKDGDGIIDPEDACPSVAGKKELKGCADGDNDGVADNLDKCPEVAGTLASKGCPEITEEVKNKISLAAKGVFFETGKDIIKKESYDDLDNLYAILAADKKLIAAIEGHTDNVGDAAKNLDLSQRRANAVKAYLINKGVSAERLTATGFGANNPIGDNTNVAGRAKNRRVEFKLAY
jgi:OmpA-OmpF porin, OOP family